MRPATIPLLVLFSSLVLVGFTFLPTRESAPISTTRLGDGPLLFAYRLPTPAGVDRISWWAWNPSKRSVWMASPEEGWAEVENNLILWSAQLEPLSAKAWQTLSGVVPVPGTVEIPAKGVQTGTFLADLPQSAPISPIPGPGEGSASTTPRKMPLIIRCGWFDRPMNGRPATIEAYQQAISAQGTVISNAITADPHDRVFTAVDNPAPPATADRM